MKTIEQKRMKLNNIKPAPYNPRVMTAEEFNKLRQSIQEFGHVQVLVVNKRNNHVVGGNQTLKALKELGYKDADVKLVDLADEEEKALNIALNRIEGKWEYGSLGQILADLKNSKIDIKLTGMDDIEIKNLSELNINIPDIEYVGMNQLQNPAEGGSPEPSTPDKNIDDITAEEWNEIMPEFQQNDELGVQQILVHFKTREDVEEFGKRLEQNITPKTKYIWFPKMERLSYSEKMYVEPDEVEDAEN